MEVEGGNIYQWLLQDPRWHQLRGWVLKRAGGHCEICKRKCSHLQIHHWFYGTGYNGKVRKPWQYRPRQLVACCRTCHVKLHRKHAHKLHGSGNNEAIHTHCGGILSTIKKWLPGAIKQRFQSHFSVRYDLQPGARWTLQQNGDMTIESIQVCREPVQAMIAKALNAMSLGKFNREMAANGYDKMFHLFMSIKLVGGPTIRMERNEVIGIKQADTKGAEQMMVPLNGAPIRLNTLWQNALQAVGSHIYEYDPITNNCQKFVNDVLQANQLLTPALQTFIVQRADNLLPMYAQKFGRWTTDLAAKFNHVLFGHGKRGGVWPPGPTGPPPIISMPQVFQDPGNTIAQQNAVIAQWGLESENTAPPPEEKGSSYAAYHSEPDPPPPSTSAPPPESKGSGTWKGVKQGALHPFQTLYRIGRRRDVFTGKGKSRKGGVWPPGPPPLGTFTYPPPSDQTYMDTVAPDDPYFTQSELPDISVEDAYQWRQGTTTPGDTDPGEIKEWMDEDDDDAEPAPPSTSAPPPEQKGTGIWRGAKQGALHPFRTLYRIARGRSVFTGKGKGGKYAHSSASQSRAQQDKKEAEDKAQLTESIQQNLQAVKDFIDAYKKNDEKAAMQIVMELTSKATGNPATAGLIPLLAGTADLISRHTNPMDPNYHTKTRQYLDAAFSLIPVVGPVLENWIAPMQEEKFNAPADSYTGQIIADPSKAKKFDGNLWMQDWSHADPTGYWKIKTADQMREYNKKYGTNYTVYGN